MDSTKRTWAKAIGWQITGLASMGVVGFLFTGSIAASGAMALVNAAIGLVCYIVYERLWARVRWGSRRAE
jgi:uncharacterized membrane protein